MISFFTVIFLLCYSQGGIKSYDNNQTVSSVDKLYFVEMNEKQIDYLIGKNVLNLPQIFDQNDYRSVGLYDVNYINGDNFFTQIEALRGFSGKLHLMLTLKKEHLFQVYSSRISVVMTLENGIILNIDSIKRYAK